MNEVSALSLPRLLVNQLLRRAQQDAPHGCWGIVSRSDRGDFRCHPLETGAVPTESAVRVLRKKLTQHGEMAWAFFSGNITEIRPSVTADAFALFQMPLMLAVALGTKGVLQLRAWRLVNGQIIPLDVSIAESGESIGS